MNHIVNRQYNILNMIKKYEDAYKNTLKLLMSRNDVVDINNPLCESLKYYKQRITSLREELRKSHETV